MTTGMIGLAPLLMVKWRKSILTAAFAAAYWGLIFFKLIFPAL
jgi:hypothetical protein